MPQCSDYGQGWSGDFPNCVYEAPEFTGTPGSLGFQDILPADVQGTPWSDFFDPYDPTREQMATTGAGIDISQLQDVWSLQSGQLDEAYGLKTGQLEEAWELQQGQLGENWGLQKGQLGENWQQRKGSLGAEAGLGYRQAIGQGSQAKRKSGMAFSGGAEEMQRMGMQDVQEGYQRAFGSGQTAYEQAMESGQMGYEQAIASGQMGYQQALETAGLSYEQALATGELGLTQGTTDIYQQLGQDIYGYVEDWEDYQRDTRNMLYGSGLDWNNEEEEQQTTLTCEQQNMQTCPDGSCEPLDGFCGADPNACPAGQTRCPDGTCQSGDDSPGDPCENHGVDSAGCPDGCSMGSYGMCMDDNTGGACFG